MSKAVRKDSAGMSHRLVTRSDVRKATMHGLARTKSDPTSLRITSGQRRAITKKSN